MHIISSIGRFRAIILTLTALLGLVVLSWGVWHTYLFPALGSDTGRAGWFAFSFASGLSMIVLPAVFPMAFVLAPLSRGMRFWKAIRMTLAFGVGIFLTLSAYGVLTALAGETGMRVLGLHAHEVRYPLYFIAGTFAFVIALAEIGLITFRMPFYAGPAPRFARARKDLARAFLLGIFLGNIGVGTPHPAMPLLLLESAASGDVFYGWLLFVVHALGRVASLFLLVLLGALGVNCLRFISDHKQYLERAIGWAMIVVAGFIVTLGLFTSGWWASSGVMQFASVAILGTPFLPDTSGLPQAGIFGQPLQYGSWVLVALWILPMWWQYARERRRVLGSPEHELQMLEHLQNRVEEERRGLEVALHIPGGVHGARYRELERRIDSLEKTRRIIESAAAYGIGKEIRIPEVQTYEEEILHLRRNWYLAFTVLLIAVFVFYFPTWVSA
jgi:cytochrome c-type biogenesis protein